MANDLTFFHLFLYYKKMPTLEGKKQNMKIFRIKYLLFLSTILLIISIFLGHTQSVRAEKLFYAVEINGVLSGYKELDLNYIIQDSRNILLLEVKTKLKLSIESEGFDLGMNSIFYLDPKTGNFLIHENEIKIGNSTIYGKMVKDEDDMRISSKSNEEIGVVQLSPNTILDNLYFYPFLIRDFVERKEEEKTYEVFNVVDGKINKVIYIKKGREDLELSGKTYQTLVLDELNQDTGLKKTRWVDINNYLAIKTIIQDRVEYLTDPSVVDEIGRANLDESLFAKVNIFIEDFRSISYLKVKANIEVTGELVTSKSLNVTGQKFLGKVENNLIEGIFEIRHKRYNGDNPPPFPPDFNKNGFLKTYLEPERFIESDDSVLTRKAMDITRDSKDSWEAGGRLSRWVAENIRSETPGGISASDVFRMRKGDCGGKSKLLIAFCRAVGIPARLVTGCVYTSYLGGGFGQHVWVELYMGEAGWIPLDVTLGEIDYLDSGHIRLGSRTTFYPQKMEIIDYEIISERL